MWTWTGQLKCHKMEDTHLWEATQSQKVSRKAINIYAFSFLEAFLAALMFFYFFPPFHIYICIAGSMSFVSTPFLCIHATQCYMTLTSKKSKEERERPHSGPERSRMLVRMFLWGEDEQPHLSSASWSAAGCRRTKERDDGRKWMAGQ